ncbi:MAG: hypothetical protein R3F65_21900 [bacterium]
MISSPGAGGEADLDAEVFEAGAVGEREEAGAVGGRRHAATTAGAVVGEVPGDLEEDGEEVEAGGGVVGVEGDLEVFADAAVLADGVEAEEAGFPAPGGAGGGGGVERGELDGGGGGAAFAGEERGVERDLGGLGFDGEDAELVGEVERVELGAAAGEGGEGEGRDEGGDEVAHQNSPRRPKEGMMGIS